MSHLRVVKPTPVKGGGQTEQPFNVQKFMLGVRLTDPDSAAKALKQIARNIGFPETYGEMDFDNAIPLMGLGLYEEELRLYGEEIGDLSRAMADICLEITIGPSIMDHYALKNLVSRLLYVRRMAKEKHKNAQS